MESHVTANKAVLGPGSNIAEKLALLMASIPITAAHITIDVYSGIAAVEMNPLWEKLWDERESGPPVQQKHFSRKSSFSLRQEEVSNYETKHSPSSVLQTMRWRPPN